MSEWKRILLAEDSANDVELTLAALAEYKLVNEVVVARDGAEDLDYLLRQGKFQGRPEGNPAVVLLDLKMPRVDGLEVLKRMRADERLRTTPVVILTSSADDDLIVEALRAGASGFLLKRAPAADQVSGIRIVAAGEALLAPSVTRRLIDHFASRPSPRSEDLSLLKTLTEREREVFRTDRAGSLQLRDRGPSVSDRRDRQNAGKAHP